MLLINNLKIVGFLIALQSWHVQNPNQIIDFLKNGVMCISLEEVEIRDWSL